MLKSIVAAASGEGSDQVAAAATSLLKQATETIASNLPEGASSLPIPLPQPPRSRAATFPLVDDDAGLLLSSEPHGGDAKAQTTEEDEDDLASQMLMRFPTYGTQSHALNKDSSSQWQEKTADWLLGGTASIPTPQQQKQQKQQQQQQLQKQQQQQRESGLLATVDEETGLCFPCEEGGNAFDRARRHNTRRQKLVNSHEWSVDEQLLWKTVRFPAMADFDPSVAARSVTQSAFNKNLRKGNTFTTRRGEVLTLKEHEKIFEQPLLEDPSRDFLAAYYYHLGVVPRAAPPDQLEAEGRKFLYLDSSSDVAGRNGGGESKDPESSAPLGKQHDQHWQGLIKQHSSPYHVNNDIRKDLALFGGLSALPESASEEKEGGEGLDYGAPGTPPRAKGLEQQQQQQQQQAPSQTPKDDRIAEVAWMPDRLCKTCYSCDTPFTVFRRRHHCRICGQVFCNTCSGYFVPAASTTSALPAASPHKLFNAIVAPGILADGSSSNNINSNNQSKITLRSCKQCYDQITAKQQEQEKKLKTAAEEEDKRRQNGNVAGGSEGVTATTPKRGTTPTAIAGTASPDVVQLQNSNGLHQNPADAIVAESAAFLGQWSKAIGAEVQGITSLATKAAGLVLEDTLTHDSSGHPSGLSTRHRLASHSSMVSSSSGTSGHRNAERNSFVREGHKHLGETAASHLEQMTAALLESDAPLLWKNVCGEVMGPAVTEAQKGETARLRAKWVNKLMGLATRCCATVDTNIKKGDMLDIRPYVKIKVIPGGSCDECTYMSGILFRKTGTNKQMPREIINPKIMLLSGGIEFTRTNRIASLDTLLEQEDKYIEILVGKILKLEPDLLMVGKGVSRRAQELLLKNNVQLLQQVKPSLLNRISRQTGATIISSTDHIMNQFGAHVLGKCHRFRFIVARDNESWVGDDSQVTTTNGAGQHRIQSLLSNTKLSNHERQAALAANMLGEDILDGSEAIQSGLAKRGVSQTYALLEGCPKYLGCTVVLRGANRAALKQIKNVFRFLVSAAYNMKLEMSYLKERCARLRPEYVVQKKNLFSSSFCVDYGGPPNNRKIRPWNGGTNNEGIQRSISGQVTAFDHQSILITSVWMTDKTQCCPAEVKGICYYSMQDVSLGQFLRDSCFNLSLKCQNPTCKKSVLDHSLSFVHNDGLINITVDHMDEPLPSAPSDYGRHPDGKDDDSEDLDDSPIATWTYCDECNEVVTPLTWLSSNTWKYSFGKFLESFFYNRDTIINSPHCKCAHPLQKNTTLFFGCGRLAAKFTYEQIRPFGVFVRKSLPIDTAFHRTRALQHLEKISKASSTLFVKFDKHIEKVAREARAVKRLSDNHHIQTVIIELNRISNEVDHAAKTLQEKIASVSEKCLNENEGTVNDAALFRFPWHARRFLFMLTSAWNEKLSAAGQAIVAMKKLSSASQRNESGIGTNVPSIVAGGDQNAEELNEGMRRLRQLHEVYSRYNLTDIHTVLPTIPGNTDQKALETEFDDDFEDPDTTIDFAAEVDADVLASRRRLYNTPQSVDTSRLGGVLSNSQIKQTPGATVKSAITRFFQRGGRERDPYVVNLGLFHDGRPRLEPGVNGIVVPVIDEQLSTVIAYSLSSKEYDNQFQNYSKIDTTGIETPNGLGTPPSAPIKSQADGNHRNPPKDTPRNPPRGQLAANMTGKKGIERRMLVRNKSHIKHTFRDLDEKGQNLCKFVCTTYWATQFHAVREAFLSQGSGSKDNPTNSSSTAQTALDIEKSFILSLSSAYSWAASGGKSGASFARTADDRFVIKCISRTELQMFLDCAPAYFEYLSKAFFHGLPTVLCKIVGVYQIGYHNRVTGKRSMEQVAVMQNIFYNKKISKIFDLKGSLRGRFAAQMKNYHDDQGSQNVSKNGSYGSDIAGGQRRYASDSGIDIAGGGTDEDHLYGHERDDSADTRRTREKGPDAPRTLLDGDFLETTFGRPMPMHDRAKEVFHMSILNDTLFLSIINVLDYSILVGIDEEKMELVVGIIDFMRQYDILKQMERVGKSIPMVVGSEAPTIIQPPLYKARFTNAMERYFMTVPSKWTTI